MRGFVAILRREILERRQVLLVAVVISLVPLAVPVARGLSGADAADARSWTALLIATAFAVGLTTALGASMLVPRIASRRIGFDLSRPVSAVAIWSAAVAAAVALAVATAAIVWAPTLLAGAKPVLTELFPGPAPTRLWPILGLAALFPLFALVHFVTLALRSRSALLALDVVLAAAAWLGLSAALSRLPAFMAPVPLSITAFGFALVAAAALVVAGYESLAFGRTDVRAAHRAASLFLWFPIAAAVVAANVYASWVLAARPADLSAREIWARPAAAGPWIEVSGQARGADARFLYDTRTGRFARTRTVDWCGPTLSGDGSRAAWIEGRDRGGGPFPIWTWRLDAASSKPAPTKLLLRGYPSLLELSADGSHLATWELGVLSVHDLARERTLVSARVPVGEREELRGRFVGPDAFRLYRVGDRAIEILQLDLRSRALERLGRIEGSGGRYFVTDEKAARLLTLDGPDHRVRLFDGATGALLATLAQEPVDSRWPALLPDGHIVLSERSSTSRRLRVFGPDGRETASIPLPPTPIVILGGEAAPGRLCIGIANKDFHYATWLVDLENASLRKVADGLQPVRVFGTPPGLGSDATKLFYGPDQRSLVRFDPLTSERRVILPEGAEP
jgi:hypothetical protein